LSEDNTLRFQVETRAPTFAPSSDMPWGTSYGAHFDSAPGRRYWRVANYLLPFFTQTPQGDFRDHIDAVAYVPMDDEHTMMFRFSWRRKSRSLHPFDKNGEPLPGLAGDWVKQLLPNTTDWYGRWRPIANASNDWNIDREAQRAGKIFSGVTEVLTQDQAAVESMGPIVDHALEHFVPSDQMVLRTRRRMVKAVERFREGWRGAAGGGRSIRLRGGPQRLFRSGRNRGMAAGLRRDVQGPDTCLGDHDAATGGSRDTHTTSRA